MYRFIFYHSLDENVIFPCLFFGVFRYMPINFIPEKHQGTHSHSASPMT